MAKSKKINNKKGTTKKNINKKIDEMETSTSYEILKVVTVLLGVLAVLSCFYLLTVFVTGNNSKQEEEKVEAEIQYDEILAGSSFNMRNDKYLVVYYDFTDTELAELTSTLSNYSYNGKYRFYTVNMNNGFNKQYVSEKSNKKPKSADELLIKGSTLIKFEDGKVTRYIEGVDKIIDYLN